MLTQLRKRKEGFTIIEVLIVLAIAGLILLVVFLAVPALQRNSRNTQIKNAAASILGGVSEFQNNNGGATPTTISVDSTGKVTIAGAAGTTAAEAKVQGGYAVTDGTTMPTTTGSLVVNVGHKCAGNTAFDTASTPRSFSIGYRIENASGSTATQCTES